MNFKLSQSPIIFPLTSMASATTHDLHFRLEELDMKQARLVGRSVLVPEIDLNDFTCRAVIDWLDVDIHIDASTQPRWFNDHIRHETGESVHVHHAGEPDEGQCYRLRFQEALLGRVIETMQVVKEKWPFLSEPRLAGIEFSIDLKPKVYSEELLARLFGVMARTHLPSRDMLKDKDDLPRFTATDADGMKMTKKVMPLHARSYSIGKVEKDQAPTYDSTYYVGKRGGPCMWRLMVKRIDRQNKTAGTFQELDDKDKRVRLEVTLGSSELEYLGLRTLHDLAEFRFQTLNRSYFQFRLPTFIPPGKSKFDAREDRRLSKFLRAGVIGLEALDKELVRVRRKIQSKREAPERVRASSTSVKYDALTRKIIQALRHMGDRQRASYEKLKVQMPNDNE